MDQVVTELYRERGTRVYGKYGVTLDVNDDGARPLALSH